MSHVFNYDIPQEPEAYVHRIGRTARAGNDGISISFCDIDELGLIKDIQKIIDMKIPVNRKHNYPMVNMTPTPKKTNKKPATTNKKKNHNNDNSKNSTKSQQYKGKSKSHKQRKK